MRRTRGYLAEQFNAREMYSSIILFYLRRAGFYVAVTLVVRDDDPVRADLARGHLKGCRIRAAGEQTLSLAQRYRQDHEMKLVHQIISKESLQHIGTSHYVQIRPFALFQLSDFLRQVSAQKDGGLPFA